MPTRAQWGTTIGLAMLAALAGATPAAAENRCYRTPAEAAQASAGDTSAAAHNSPVAADGYRLEALGHDALRGGNWATVAACGHPERPVVLVRVEGSVASAEAAVNVTPRPRAPWAILAGSPVRLVWTETLVRMQAPGIATASAGIGERLKVRLGEQTVVEGTVRDGQTVEIR